MLRVEERVTTRLGERRLQRGKRAVEVSLRPQRLREQSVQPCALWPYGYRRIEPALGFAGLSEAKLQGSQRFDQLHLHRRILDRSRERPYRRRSELGVEHRPRGRFEGEGGEALDGIARTRRVVDGSTEVKHRGKAVMRSAAQRIVQRAALGAQHTFERLPRKLAQALERADLSPERRPKLLERVDERRPRSRLVEGRVHTRLGPAVTRVEREELDRPVAITRRFEGPGEHDPDPSPRFAGDVAPGSWRNEGLDRTRSSIHRVVVAPPMQLRDCDPAAFDVREGVDEGSEAEAQPASRGGNPERDDDRMWVLHVSSTSCVQPRLRPSSEALRTTVPSCPRAAPAARAALRPACRRACPAPA